MSTLLSGEVMAEYILDDVGILYAVCLLSTEKLAGIPQDEFEAPSKSESIAIAQDESDALALIVNEAEQQADALRSVDVVDRGAQEEAVDLVKQAASKLVEVVSLIPNPDDRPSPPDDLHLISPASR